MSEYQIWQLLVYGCVVLVLVGVMMTLSPLLGECRKIRQRTGQPYESGILPTHTADIRIPVQFYLMAMLFVIFDMEAVFIFAWAVVVPEAGWLGFWEMTIFIGILFVALIYLWKIGALDWGPRLDHIRARMESSRLSSNVRLKAEQERENLKHVGESSFALHRPFVERD